MAIEVKYFKEEFIANSNNKVILFLKVIYKDSKIVMQLELFNKNKANCQSEVLSKPCDIIKVCPDPTCEQVEHYCQKKATYCTNCGHRVMEINKETYLKKFVRNTFQFDNRTNERVYPEDLGYDPGYTQDELNEMKAMHDFVESIKTNNGTKN